MNQSTRLALLTPWLILLACGGNDESTEPVQETPAIHPMSLEWTLPNAYGTPVSSVLSRADLENPRPVALLFLSGKDATELSMATWMSAMTEVFGNAPALPDQGSPAFFLVVEGANYLEVDEDKLLSPEAVLVDEDASLRRGMQTYLEHPLFSPALVLVSPNRRMVFAESRLQPQEIRNRRENLQTTLQRQGRANPMTTHVRLIFYEGVGKDQTLNDPVHYDNHRVIIDQLVEEVPESVVMAAGDVIPTWAFRTGLDPTSVLPKTDVFGVGLNESLEWPSLLQAAAANESLRFVQTDATGPDAPDRAQVVNRGVGPLAFLYVMSSSHREAVRSRWAQLNQIQPGIRPDVSWRDLQPALVESLSESAVRDAAARVLVIENDKASDRAILETVRQVEQLRAFGLTVVAVTGEEIEESARPVRMVDSGWGSDKLRTAVVAWPDSRETLLLIDLEVSQQGGQRKALFQRATVLPVPQVSVPRTGPS